MRWLSVPHTEFAVPHTEFVCPAGSNGDHSGIHSFSTEHLIAAFSETDDCCKNHALSMYRNEISQHRTRRRENLDLRAALDEGVESFLEKLRHHLLVRHLREDEEKEDEQVSEERGRRSVGAEGGGGRRKRGGKEMAGQGGQGGQGAR